MPNFGAARLLTLTAKSPRRARLGRAGPLHRLPTASKTLRSFGSKVRADMDELAELIARETGKPMWEARTEVEWVANKVDISIKAYADRTSQRLFDGKPGSRNAVRHKPHGVLAVLGPYNFPAHLPNGHIVPALLAGNAVVFKPSEKTPAVGERLVELYRKAGIPEGVVRIAQGGVDVGKALSMHPDIDGLLFTGSAQTGIALNRQFATRPDKILALEMGGNNPIIVWDTRDIAQCCGAGGAIGVSFRRPALHSGAAVDYPRCICTTLSSPN